jgi:hypothetical protein
VASPAINKITSSQPRQHGHSVETIWRTYSAWMEGALESDIELWKIADSFRLPHLPPGSEFRRTDSIGGEIAFMQAYEFGFGQLGETPAVGGIDFFL